MVRTRAARAYGQLSVHFVALLLQSTCPYREQKPVGITNHAGSYSLSKRIASRRPPFPIRSRSSAKSMYVHQVFQPTNGQKFFRWTRPLEHSALPNTRYTGVQTLPGVGRHVREGRVWMARGNRLYLTPSYADCFQVGSFVRPTEIFE